MTVSMRVMSAGDGYKYLLKTISAADGDRSLSTPLTRYYAEAGTPPGRWLGAGVGALGHGELSVGDHVSEPQLQLLIGMGRDPVSGNPLGLAFPVYKTQVERIESRIAALDPALTAGAKGEDEDLKFLMQSHPVHEMPLHNFTEHSSSVTIEFSTSDKFGHVGHGFVAQYGTEAPFSTGGKPVSAGRAVVRLDLYTMTEHPFFESKTVAGIGKGPNRPVNARFSPDGEALYVIDHGVRTVPMSGGIWKITRS